MAKRVFIVHGWGGSPKSDWLPWLSAELSKKGFTVVVPEMPNTEKPEIVSWIMALSKAVGKPDEETYFVGHSIGCQTILRYLEAIPPDVKVGGAVFVAGWFTLTGLETEEEEKIARPWIEEPFDAADAAEKAKGMIAIFSDDDPYVPLKENSEIFGGFCRKIIVEKGKRHINIKELPSILNAVLEVSKV